MKNDNVDVSFITINYNSSQHTIKLVNSIIKNSLDLSYQIIIIDNNSEYNDFLQLKNFNSNSNIQLIRNRINSGFSSGNMLGVNYAVGNYYFFINNDVVLINNTSKILKDFMDNNKDVAVCTSMNLDEKNNVVPSYSEFPRILEKFFGRAIQRAFSKQKFYRPSKKLNTPIPVDVIAGSCMFFNAEYFCELGGFDTAFFLYCEEEDVCKRVWDYGKKVYYVPEAKISHKAGGSTKRNFEIEREFYISYYHLIRKHYAFLGCFLMKFALFIKLFFRIFKRKNGFKMFLSMFTGFSSKKSLRNTQTIRFR